MRRQIAAAWPIPPTTVARLACDEPTARRVAAIWARRLTARTSSAALSKSARAVAGRDVFPHAAGGFARAVAAAAGAAAAAARHHRTGGRSRLGGAEPGRALRRCAPAVSSCTARTTARASQPTPSASRSRRRWPSAPATTAPPAAACWRSMRWPSGGAPSRILDIGTGTGVLAIAAAQGCCARASSRATSTAVAVAAAREQCAAQPRRRCDHARACRRRAARARSRRAAPYDLIFANILLGPLLRLAVPIRRLAAPGARVVLSGLLPRTRQCGARRLPRAGFALERRIPLDGWMTLVLRRPAIARRGSSTLECRRCARGQLPDIRRCERARAERRARRRLARRTQAPRARRLRRCRAPTASRTNICRRAKSGWPGSPASPARPARPSCWPSARRCSSTAATPCRRARRSMPRCSPSSIWSIHRPSNGSSRISRAAPSSATIPGCTPPTAPRSCDKACAKAGAELVPVDDNPIDALWTRPAGAAARPRGAARHQIRRRERGRQAQAHPRRTEKAARRRAGGVRSAERRLDLQHPRRRTSRIRRWRSPSPPSRARAARRSMSMAASSTTTCVTRCEEIADVRAPDDLARDLAELEGQDRAARPGQRGRRARRAWSTDSGGKPARGADPITLMKAVKNHAEIAGARAAHVRDGAAMARFLAWLDARGAEGQADRDRRGRSAGELPPRHRRCSRIFRFRPSPAPGRTARSCITG